MCVENESMAEWVWEGRTRAGELRKGVIEAETERDVQARLRQQNIMLEKVKQKRKGISCLSFLKRLPVPARGLRSAVCNHDRCRAAPGVMFGDSLAKSPTSIFAAFSWT